ETTGSKSSHPHYSGTHGSVTWSVPPSNARRSFGTDALTSYVPGSSSVGSSSVSGCPDSGLGGPGACLGCLGFGFEAVEHHGDGGEALVSGVAAHDAEHAVA